MDADAVATTPPTTDLPRETLEFFNGDDLRARVFHDKYAVRSTSGTVLEKTPREMWRRVAREIAVVEPDEPRRTQWAEEFFWLLSDFRFIPGGRIMHAAGQNAFGRKAIPINCFVIPIKADSLEAIYECAKEMAITYSRGGGVGTDVSILRPAGAEVHNAARVSTGAVSFMETFSLVTGTIGMEGRRGALMLTIRDDHPDVLAFCRIKRDLKSVRYANISVLVSDAFMHAVEQDDDWRLHYDNPEAGVHVERTIKARELWNEMVTGARDWAEPGCLFIDAARRRGTTEYGTMRVLTTNPCGEQFLDPYNNCCLGSLNVLTFVRKPFAQLPTEQNVDWSQLRRSVRAGIRFLDDVVTYADPLFPLDTQRDAARRTRRVGLGVTGLGDMLIALRLRYDTEDAIEFAGRLMEFIKLESYRASLDLAKEKGSFPAFQAEEHLAQEVLREFPSDLREQITEHGLRNAATMTVPPVGSGAALAGVTSGIEPMFALAYLRRSESLSQERFWVLHPLAVRYWEEFVQKPMPVDSDGFVEAARSELPAFFVTAHEIDPMQRVRIQASISRHVDNAVSSTINLPKQTTVEQVGQLYFEAWRQGLKGVTCYREGSREGILITVQEAKSGSVESPSTTPEPSRATSPRPRPKVTRGRTERVETPRGRIYVVVNEDELGVCEVFVHSFD
ncbi:MAG: adenosylcobalamin-dependent ribonucleoside-diphosphate reductase, partial [bacterium]